MGKYDSFIANKYIAHQYYNGSIDTSYPGYFWLTFDKWVRTNGVECEIHDSLEAVQITSKNFQIILELNSNGAIERARVQGIGETVKRIRNSIWETKTFFGVPVFMVLNTSFDDESYWEEFPRQFMVSMVTPDNINFIL